MGIAYWYWNICGFPMVTIAAMEKGDTAGKFKGCCNY
jgi:hypothetical protein